MSDRIWQKIMDECFPDDADQGYEAALQQFEKEAAIDSAAAFNRIWSEAEEREKSEK